MARLLHSYRALPTPQGLLDGKSLPGNGWRYQEESTRRKLETYQTDVPCGLHFLSKDVVSSCPAFKTEEGHVELSLIHI